MFSITFDPDNRLVADQLEADWNGKLRNLRSAQDEYEQQRQNEQRTLRMAQREKILALAADFPRVWNDPNPIESGNEWDVCY